MILSTRGFTTRIVDERAIDAALEQRIRDFLVSCFPKDTDAFSRSRGWHGSMPAYTVLIEEPWGRRIAAHAGVVDRALSAADQRIRVAGVQNVCVAPALRGERLVDRAMGAAMDAARSRGFDAGMLFCTPALCPVYARTGWKELSGRAFAKRDENGVEAPFALTDAAMIYPLARNDLPPGVIHLNGNDW